jgi:hypothetical protein
VKNHFVGDETPFAARRHAGEAGLAGKRPARQSVAGDGVRFRAALRGLLAPVFFWRWLAAFAGGTEGGRATVRPASFPFCGLGAFAAGADLVTRWAADVRSVRLSLIAATATSSGTSRIPARFQYGVAPGCMKRPSIDHQPIGRDCADFASTGQPGGVTFVLRQRPFSRRTPDRRTALLHRRIDPYARLGFAALNPFHDLRQTQFHGKERSVSDLVTCDFHKPP